MSYVKVRACGMLTAMAIVLVISQVAEAQREGGRRDRGGRGARIQPIPAVELVAQSDDVRAAVNVTEDQQAKIDAIADGRRDALRSVWEQRDQDFRAAREAMEKANQDASAKLAEVLDEGQRKRLMGISIQVNGANAVFDSAVAEELNITEEQEDKLAEARRSQMRAMRGGPDGGADLSREERRARAEQRRAEADKKLLAMLTDQQQAQLEQLKGEPVEVDMSDFRGRGRDGDRRGRDGERRGRGRNRPNRDAERSSDAEADSGT